MKIKKKPHKKFEYFLSNPLHNIDNDIGMKIIHKLDEIESPPIIPPVTGVIYFKNLLVFNNLSNIKILINLLKINLSVPLSARILFR